MAFNYDNYKETENGYPLQGRDDKPGEYSFVRTDICGNTMYLGGRKPMEMDGRICPKCGRIIKIVGEKETEKYI